MFTIKCNSKSIDFHCAPTALYCRKCEMLFLRIIVDCFQFVIYDFLFLASIFRYYAAFRFWYIYLFVFFSFAINLLHIEVSFCALHIESFRYNDSVCMRKVFSNCCLLTKETRNGKEIPLLAMPIETLLNRIEKEPTHFLCVQKICVLIHTHVVRHETWINYCNADKKEKKEEKQKRKMTKFSFISLKKSQSLCCALVDVASVCVWHAKNSCSLHLWIYSYPLEYVIRILYAPHLKLHWQILSSFKTLVFLDVKNAKWQMQNAKWMNACSTWIIKGWIMELTWKRHRQHFYSPFRFISIFSSVKCLRSHDAFAYELETINTWTCNNMCTYVFGVQQFDYNEKIKIKNWWTFFYSFASARLLKLQ